MQKCGKNKEVYKLCGNLVVFFNEKKKFELVSLEPDKWPVAAFMFGGVCLLKKLGVGWFKIHCIKLCLRIQQNSSFLNICWTKQICIYLKAEKQYPLRSLFTITFKTEMLGISWNSATRQPLKTPCFSNIKHFSTVRPLIFRIFVYEIRFNIKKVSEIPRLFLFLSVWLESNVFQKISLQCRVIFFKTGRHIQFQTRFREIILRKF